MQLPSLAIVDDGADVLAMADGSATRHRVVLSGLATKTEAQAYARSLKARGGLGAPWVLAP